MVLPIISTVTVHGVFGLDASPGSPSSPVKSSAQNPITTTENEMHCSHQILALIIMLTLPYKFKNTEPQDNCLVCSSLKPDMKSDGLYKFRLGLSLSNSMSSNMKVNSLNYLNKMGIHL